jgi:hypothetical protein
MGSVSRLRPISLALLGIATLWSPLAPCACPPGSAETRCAGASDVATCCCARAHMEGSLHVPTWKNPFSRIPEVGGFESVLSFRVRFVPLDGGFDPAPVLVPPRVLRL